MRIFRVLCIGILSLFIMLSGLLSACSTPVSAAEISQKTVAAASQVNSFKCDMSMSTEVSALSQTDQFTGKADIDYSAWMDYTNRQLKAVINGSIDTGDDGTQNISMQMYLLDGWYYMNVNIPLLGSQWMKMQMSDDSPGIWDSEDQLAQQIQLLQTAVETKSIGSETIDGIDCYVLQIGPDLNALVDWLASQNEDTGLWDASKADLPDIYDDVTLKIWVAKSTFLPMKETLEMSMQATPQDFDASSTETGSATVTLKATIKYYDYNVPLNILLPDGAADAVDVANIASSYLGD